MSDIWRAVTKSKAGRALLDRTPIGSLAGVRDPFGMMIRGTDAIKASGLESNDCETFTPLQTFNIFPSEEFERQPPTFGPQRDREIYHQGLLARHIRHQFRSRPADVLVIDNAIVEFPTCSVMVNGKFVEEATLAVRQFLKPSVFLPTTRGPITEIKGDAALLPIQFWRSYGHWHTDVLPRWEAMQAAPAPQDAPYLFAQKLSEFHQATLKAAGVPEDRRQLMPEGRYRVERLWLPTRTMEYSNIHPRNIRWVRDTIAPNLASPTPKRRLYISRGDAKVRRILNEDELFAKLEPLGFERIVNTDFDWRGQAQNFRDAEVVVGPHGTNMANSLFCQEGAALLEIFGESVVDGSWSMVSQVLGLRYGVVQTELAGEHSIVDVPKVLSALSDISIV